MTESRYFDAYSVAPRANESPATGERCSVGFWNQTASDLTLRVEGRAYTLRRGTSLFLNLGRQFAWQVDGRAAEVERVAAMHSALEIVIRR